MSIYLGSSEPSKIYVGSSEVSAVYVGTEKVRPSGWTPDASRTLLYLPLASDVSDQSGNTGRTFSTSGLTYTTVGGVQSVHIGTTGGIKLTSPSPLVDNNTAHQTISLLFYVTSATSTSRRSLLQFWIPSKTCTLMILSENTTNIHVGGVSSGSDLDAAFTANTWNHVVLTNGSNGKKLYLNGNLISSGTGSSTPRGMASNSENGQVLFNDRNGITKSQGLNGNAREVILENVEWSADNVADYYTWIKAKLGF